MMAKRKILSIIALIPFAFSSVTVALGALAACKNDDEPPAPKDRAGYVLKDNRAYITWDAVEGSTGYIIQKSRSRYSGYADVDFVEKGTQYVSEDIYDYFRIAAVGADGNVTDYLGPYSYDLQTFGENTYIYSPTDKIEDIQADLDGFYKKTDGTVENKRARGEFSDDRFSAFFKAGEYDLDINLGYYMTVSGLGASPDDVTVSRMNADAPISLCNFWRTVENLAVDGDMLWSVSQATSLRRVHVKGNLSLSGRGSTSGGFLADTKVDGSVNSGSQQQWFSRSSRFGSWNGGVWNMAFVGVEGNIPVDSWENKHTVIEESGTLKEKPFLTFDESAGYRVFVPGRKSGSGISWADGAPHGTYIPLSDFYVARSDRDTSATINAALSEGKHLFLTAGVYELDEPINVTRENTVIVGTGMATLRPSERNTQTLMRIADVGGVEVGGILFDAGVSTQTLLDVGEAGSEADHSQNFSVLSDLFFRVGGAREAKTEVESCVVVNSNNVIGDNFWIWRADHWDGVGWNTNVAENGVTVNGDNVTFYGLFVEHFLGYQTLWNGNGGTTYFYQSELPYDVPGQNVWLSHDGTVNGYSSYKVADKVTSHRAYALGVYSYLRDAEVRLENAIECPENGDIEFYHVITVYLSGNVLSGIDHVINGNGGAAQKGATVNGVEKYSAAK